MKPREKGREAWRMEPQENPRGVEQGGTEGGCTWVKVTKMSLL
jgi:hypothetical protein